VQAAQHSRLTGQVSIGLAPTTAAVLGLPLVRAMRDRYPDVRLRLVESLSGFLTTMLIARQLDLAILFRADAGQRWSVLPLLEERLFVIGLATLPGMPRAGRVRLERLAELPLVLPSGPHGLRATIDAAFAQARVTPRVVAEIDGLAMLMDAVRDGLGATIQPGAALARLDDSRLVQREVADRPATRSNLLVSLSDDELSPAGLAVRVVIVEVARQLVRDGRWPGARLHAQAVAAPG
jgi:LysR family tcuABC transcriptional regulator